MNGFNFGLGSDDVLQVLRGYQPRKLSMDQLIRINRNLSDWNYRTNFDKNLDSQLMNLPFTLQRDIELRATMREYKARQDCMEDMGYIARPSAPPKSSSSQKSSAPQKSQKSSAPPKHSAQVIYKHNVSDADAGAFLALLGISTVSLLTLGWLIDKADR